MFSVTYPDTKQVNFYPLNEAFCNNLSHTASECDPFNTSKVIKCIPDAQPRFDGDWTYCSCREGYILDVASGDCKPCPSSVTSKNCMFSDYGIEWGPMVIYNKDCEDASAYKDEAGECKCGSGYMDPETKVCKYCPDKRCVKCSDSNPEICLTLKTGYEWKNGDQSSGEIIDCGEPAHDPKNPAEPFLSTCHREGFDDIISYQLRDP